MMSGVSRRPATRRPDAAGCLWTSRSACTTIAAPLKGLPEPRVPKVKVDRERCQGHARCAALAPELFSLDELGNAREIGDGTVPPALVEKAWLAKANCPELAIAVEEDT